MNQYIGTFNAFLEILKDIERTIYSGYLSGKKIIIQHELILRS